MFNGYDFVYDNKSSLSENLKMLNIDGDAFEFVQGVPSKEVDLFHANQSGKWEISGNRMTEPFSFPLQIMLHGDGEETYDKINPSLERNRLSRIYHWLFDKTDFKKLQILMDDMRDLYFMAVFKDVELFEDGGVVRGFKATVLCDTIGAWEEKNVIKNCTGNLTWKMQVLQDGIYEVTPLYKIEMRDTSATISVNGESIELENITPGSTITIDTDKLIAKSSEGDELYDSGRFNRCFPRFVYGDNTISISGNCKVTINYKMIREVGC